jgi:Holliday junction resolvase RusA-like endonuclease
MSEIISLDVLGVAVGKPRPRVTSRGAFLPTAYREWQALVRDAAIVAAGELEDRGTPWPAHAERYRVDIVVVPPDRRGRDVDNLAGGILDALNGVLWRDDRLVVDLRCRRVEPSKLAPHALIRAWALVSVPYPDACRVVPTTDGLVIRHR